ncbi:MAG: hypothetical protein GC159_10470 [Phycisphaera sp.]|nr:hypothetical protein [Phycisphaera sp.]
MPNIATILKDEIARVARKEIKRQTATLQKQSAQYRRDVAELKRQVSDLQKRLSFIENQEKRRLANSAPIEKADEVRYSPKWVARHRAKLGLSAENYGKLVGVSGLTIYNWEAGKSRPRKKQLAGWASVRNLGKREALKRLELLEG